MKEKIKWLFFAFLLVLSPALSGQSVSVTGSVVEEESGLPLPGATIQVMGTQQSTVSDVQGSFTIAAPVGSTLIISYVGKEEFRYTVTAASAQGTVSVLMKSSTADATPEVVVIGYGTQRVTKVSGAISTIKQQDIQKLNPVRAEEALQGRAAGVNVIQGGSPGSRPTVLIRGIPSFSGTDPTVIVDGIPQSLSDLNSINANDIESINVLKDAAATAVYGVKGGNGVIVVTTRTGRKNMKPEININSSYGVQEVMNYLGVLNASEYAAMVNEGSTLAGGNPVFTDISQLGVGSNWQKEIFKTAPLQTHNINLRGGSNNVTYFLSGGYLSQGGIVGGYDKSRFNRGTLTANFDIDISRKVKFILNATGVILDGKGVQENSFNSIIGSALNFDPTVALLNTNPDVPGKYGYSNLLLSEIFNPLTKLDNTYNQNKGNKLYGKFEFQYKPVTSLVLTSRFGYTKYDANSKSFNPLVYYGPLNVENTMYADGSALPERHNSVSHEKVSNFNYTWENFANYNLRLMEDHNFDFVAGMSIARISGNGASASRQDVPYNSWTFANFSAATGSNNATNSNALSGGYYQYFRNNLSYFGRMNYDYLDKYLVSGTFRRDGSYAFGTDNKYGDFFSGSLGWVVSKENWFINNAINFLKLRASYGAVGNENVSPQVVQIITGGPSYGSTANSNGYNFNNIFYPGSTVGSAANTGLKWERQEQINAGFDLRFGDSKFSLSADYFIKKVNGLLFTPSASLYLGTVPLPTANIGSTRSDGIDATLAYNNRTPSGFGINTSLTFTTAKNVVTATNEDGSARIFGGSYFNGQSQTVTVFEKDQTPGYFWGWKTDGLFQNFEEVTKWATQPGAQPGDIRFVDVNGDGVINAEDKTKIGDPFPQFTLGYNLGLDYKGFDFTAFLYASVGNDVYRAYERNANYSNKDRRVLGRWTGPGTTNDAQTPRYSFTDANSNIRVSDRYVEDGSFLKLKNVQLGYTIPASVMKNYFKSVRLYVQVRNAFVLTNYTGFDPEIPGGILDTGVDRGAYPQARTYSAGIDIRL